MHRAPPTIDTPTGKFTTGAKQLAMPAVQRPSSQTSPQTGGTALHGQDIIRLNGALDGRHQLHAPASTTDQRRRGRPTACSTSRTTAPARRVSRPPPTTTSRSTCGNVYVSGTYSKSLTIAAANDVIIRPTIGGKLDNSSNDANITQVDGSDATLGLIANNFVRVGHQVVRSTDSLRGNFNSTTSRRSRTSRIDAAILSLQHSFIVDNYDCGNASGKLTVNGAIVAEVPRPGRHRQPAARIASGYLKNYWYDDRLRYRSPPYFLDAASTPRGTSCARTSRSRALGR